METTIIRKKILWSGSKRFVAPHKGCYEYGVRIPLEKGIATSLILGEYNRIFVVYNDVENTSVAPKEEPLDSLSKDDIKRIVYNLCANRRIIR